MPSARKTAFISHSTTPHPARQNRHRSSHQAGVRRNGVRHPKRLPRVCRYGIALVKEEAPFGGLGQRQGRARFLRRLGCPRYSRCFGASNGPLAFDGTRAQRYLRGHRHGHRFSGFSRSHRRRFCHSFFRHGVERAITHRRFQSGTGSSWVQPPDR